MVSPAYRALLIGNSTFPDDPHNLPELEGPRNDPVLLHGALCDSRYGMFAKDNVRLVQERTASEVLLAIEDFFATAARQETLLLYYSGHGRLSQSNELFLCMRNTLCDRLQSTAVNSARVSEMIDQSAAAATVILLDCCHAAAFKGGDIASPFAGRGRFVVTSCRRGELANDTATLNHASLFTHHLVAGLLGGAPDHDGDGLVDLSELYHYVHRALVAENRQRPERRFAGEDVPIAARPGGPPDPSEVLPELDVSTTEIDLGEVHSGDELAPERIAVINRGTGTLDWSVRTEAGWIDHEIEGNVVVLHLHPRPGFNRGNVHVYDHRTGSIKTVRVSVRVRPATPPPPPPPRGSPRTLPHPPQPGPEQVLASWGSRIGAAVIDGMILALFLTPGFVYFGVGSKETEPCTDDPSGLCEVPTDVTAGVGLGLMAIGLIGWCIYKIVLDGGPRGQSLGKRAVGIRVVDMRSGDAIGHGKAAGRTLVVIALMMCTGGILLVVDLLSPLWDEQRQTFHDKVVGSAVVRH